MGHEWDCVACRAWVLRQSRALFCCVHKVAFELSLLKHPFHRQILRLYVAAYQNPVIWKDLWRQLVGVISVQIIRDIDQFVAKNEFAHEAVMALIISS